jgi:hypothetical protein
MAVAIDFQERNDYIGKPKDLTDNQCYALPVSRIITVIPGETDRDKAESVLAHVSCWRLTEEERIEVARTGNVFVKILGITLFPMSVHGIKPINEGAGELCDKVLTKEQISSLK